MENHQYRTTAGLPALRNHSAAGVVGQRRHRPVYQAFLVLSMVAGALFATGFTRALANSESGPMSPFSELVDLEGQAVSQGPMVGDGKWTLVMIWVTNCHVCRAQKAEINAFHEAHREQDATVVGIAMDGSAKLSKVKRFLARYEVTFPSYVGDMMSVMKQYEALTRESFEGTPTYLLFDRAGTLRGNNSGPITVSAIERFIERHDDNR